MVGVNVAVVAAVTAVFSFPQVASETVVEGADACEGRVHFPVE